MIVKILLIELRDDPLVISRPERTNSISSGGSESEDDIEFQQAILDIYNPNNNVQN